MVSVGEIPSFNTLGKCNRPVFSLGRRKYIIDILNCHFSGLCCGYKFYETLDSLEICVGLTSFPSLFCSAYSPEGS